MLVYTPILDYILFYMICSTFGNTYTKVHNRLTNERVEKLVSDGCNFKLFEPTQVDMNEYDGSDAVLISSSESDGGNEGKEMQIH